jgi:hypothetical protein
MFPFILSCFFVFPGLVVIATTSLSVVVRLNGIAYYMHQIAEVNISCVNKVKTH